MVRDSDSQSRISRRQWLKASAVGSTLLLAGCSSANQSPGGNDSGLADRYLRLLEGTPPNQSQLNYWAAGYHGEMANICMPRHGQFSATSLDWVPVDASGWEVKNDELRIHLRKGQSWTDGTKLTAKDWVIYYELDQLLIPKDARDPDPVITGYRAEDDRTIVCTLNTEAGYNVPAAENEVINRQLGPGVRRGSVFEKKLQALKDATTKSARDKIRQEVVGISLKLPDVQVAGPYKPVSANAREAVFETIPDHGITKYNKINWKGVKAKYLGEESPAKVASAFASNEIDLWHALTPPGVQMADNHVNIINYETGGTAFMINHGYGPDKKAPNDPAMDIFKDHRVRQAMAYVIDRPSVAKSAMPGGQQHVTLPTGLLERQVKQHFPDLYPKLDTYERTSQNVKKAEQLMKEAGCTRTSAGTWTYEGQKLQTSLISIGDGEWAGANQGVTNWLKKFGIEISSAILSNTQITARTEAGRFESVLDVWGYGIPALYMAYLGQYDPSNPNANWQPPDTFEAPKTIGDWDAPLKEWNTKELIQGMGNQPLEKNKKAVKKLVWVTNYAQPYIPLLRDASGLQINTKTFDWPPVPPKMDDYHFHLVPKENSKYPSLYGFEQEESDVRRGHWGPKWTKEMKAKSMR